MSRILFVLVFVASLCSAQQITISQCGTFGSGSYIINTSISSTAMTPCLSFASADALLPLIVSLDGQNNTLETIGPPAISANGNSVGASKVEIRNLQVVAGTGVNAYNLGILTVARSTFDTSIGGFYITTVKYVEITNNFFTRGSIGTSIAAPQTRQPPSVYISQNIFSGISITGININTGFGAENIFITNNNISIPHRRVQHQHALLW